MPNEMNIGDLIDSVYVTWKKAEPLIDSVTQKIKSGKTGRQLNPYLILLALATNEDLKDIYKIIARRVHPDHGGSEEKMKMLNVVWEIIKKHKKIV